MTDEIIINSNHLELLSQLRWEWDDCEYGAPAVNPKRPYGNSDVEEDIAEILGWDIGENGLTEFQQQTAYELHSDLLKVIPKVISEYLGMKK